MIGEHHSKQDVGQREGLGPSERWECSLQIEKDLQESVEVAPKDEQELVLL